jgi:hypothetical protein
MAAQLRVPACLVVNACFLDHGDENVIGLPGDGHALRRHLSDDSDRDARAWEWMAHDKVVMDAKLPAKFSHLVLEKLPQGLDQLETLL